MPNAARRKAAAILAAATLCASAAALAAEASAAGAPAPPAGATLIMVHPAGTPAQCAALPGGARACSIRDHVSAASAKATLAAANAALDAAPATASRTDTLAAGAAGQQVRYPNWCETGGYRLTGACRIDGYTDYTINSKGKVTGSISYNIIEYSFWSIVHTDFITQVEIDPYMYTGDGNTGWYVGASAGAQRCTKRFYNTPGTCKHYARSFHGFYGRLHVPADYPTHTDHHDGSNAYNSVMKAGQNVQWAHGYAWYSVYHGDAVNAGKKLRAHVTFYVDCDDAMPGHLPGCKSPTDYYTPTLTYRLYGNYPAVAREIRAAQRAGIGGNSASGRYLQRTTNRSVIGANRRVSCPKSRGRRPKHYSCDEYPFATTYQGAAANPHRGVTFRQCHISTLPRRRADPRWDACMVPATQNSGAGGVLPTFWARHRTLDNDRFWVRITR